MQFGIMMRGQFPPEANAANEFDALMKLARRIEQLGYSSITKGAHYGAYPLQDLSQIPFLARVAAEAPSLCLVTGVMLLPLHKPLDVAEQLGTLDIMTNGKLIFGCGVGYRDLEFEAFGTSRRERGRRFEENLIAVKRLWTEETVTMKGSHFNLVEAGCSAEPVQKPHPPIWIGGSADAVIRRAARLGSCWYIGPKDRLDVVAGQVEIYKRALDEADKPFPAEFPFRREVFVAKTREEAYRLAKEPVMTKYRHYNAWDVDRSGAGGSGELGQPFEELIKDRFFIGSPDDVAEQIVTFHKRVGMNHVVASMHWPGLAVERSIEAMELFAEEVIPRVRQGI